MIGQEAGICTRTVSFTGRDAASYTTILRENPKPEFRSPNEFRNSNAECTEWPIRVLGLGFLSDFPSGALPWICTTNLRLRRAACRTNYTLRANVASVIGLAPIRPDLKGRLRELLCIHGRWPLESGLRRHLRLFRPACRLTTPSSGEDGCPAR